MKKSKTASWMDLEKKLSTFGFEHVNHGTFFHSLTGQKFDFSACSLEGVIDVIFRQGMERGAEEVTYNIKNILNL